MSISRLISGVLLSLFVMLIIFVLPNWAFAVVATVLIILALYEFFTLVEKKGIALYKYFGTFIGALIPLSIYFKFEPTKGWELFFIVAACLSLFLLQFTRHESSQAIVAISATLFGILYVSWFFSFIIKLKLLSDASLGLYGASLVLFLLLVTKLGDVGAYFVGTYFGKHSLVPRISPKKSVEGALGGLIFSILAAYFAKALLPLKVTAYHPLILGFLLGVLGQVGDLSESLVKRDCQVKDSGTIIPGMGGVLDIIDSLLFTAPIFYFYIRFLL